MFIVSMCLINFLKWRYPVEISVSPIEINGGVLRIETNSFIEVFLSFIEFFGVVVGQSSVVKKN